MRNLSRVGFLCADYEDLVDLLGTESPTVEHVVAWHVSFPDGTYVVIHANGSCDKEELGTWHVDSVKSESKRALENLQTMMSFRGDVVDTASRNSKRKFSWEN